MNKNLKLSTYNTKVISCFAGSGAGKSIFAADLFAKLKWNGYVAELATEYVKSKQWEGHFEIFKNQIYLFGKQHNTIHRLLGKVEYIVTDSPFLMGIAYDIDNNIHLRNLIIVEHKKLNSINIFLNRDESKYETVGRNQNLEQAKELDRKIKNILIDNNIEFSEVLSSPQSVDVVYQKIITNYY